jgi:hypothetical protein
MPNRSLHQWIGIALSLTLVFGAAAQAGAVDSSGIAQEDILKRIVMIGASATSGFTKKELLGGTNTQFLQLNRYVDAAITAPHESVQNMSSAFFFTNPQKYSETQMARALKADPTLVVGLDFLFWCCYGKGSNDVERLTRFDQGLKLLESVPCPLVVGDLPDASGAVGKLLSPEQMPGSNVLAAANARLAVWAAPRTNVIVISLANFMRAAVRDEPVEAKHNAFAAGTTRRLLQEDGLHPTTAGCSVLTLAVLEAVEAKHNIAKAVEWNPQSIELSVAEAVRTAQLAAATNRAAVKQSAPPGTQGAVQSR